MTTFPRERIDCRRASNCSVHSRINALGIGGERLADRHFGRLAALSAGDWAELAAGPAWSQRRQGDRLRRRTRPAATETRDAETQRNGNRKTA